jgi:hypothetical protein
MKLLKRSASGLFASESMAGHLIRGAVGMMLLAWAVRHQAQVGWSLLAAFGALLAFRGCPVCWTIGLAETVTQKWQQFRKFRKSGPA